MIVNIEKKTGKVVDVNQRFDERFYENREVPDGTVPDYIHDKPPYVLDSIDDIIKERPRVVLLHPTYIMLMDGEAYGSLHKHPNDQLVVVLAGVVEIAEGQKSTSVIPATSYRILKGVEHLITGAADNSLILTIQI